MLGSEAHINFSETFPLGGQEGQIFWTSPKKRSDYYPFGLTMPGRSSNTGNPNDDYKYTGHERDDEAGLTLDYMGARYYDPLLNRFYSIDPYAAKFPNVSPYVYALNNPINMWDPDGRAPSSANGCPLCFYSLQVALSVEETKYLASQGMRSSEINVVKENRWASGMIALNGNRGIAENMAKNSGLPGLKNGPGDALRHSLFNALNTQTAGPDVTKALGDAHEQDRPNVDPLEVDMDLHNNAVGIEVGATNPNASPKQLTDMLLDRMQKGDLKVIIDGKVVNSSLSDKQLESIRNTLKTIYEDGEKEYE